MDNKSNKTRSEKLKIYILPDMRSDIDLHGAELLKMDIAIEQPEARVECTEGTLWLTQPGDPQDHLLKAGQSFVVNHAGTVLVQGLPNGKARILSPASTAV